jgi:hypothetical protein
VYHISSLALRGQLTAYPLPTLFTPCSDGGGSFCFRNPSTISIYCFNNLGTRLTFDSSASGKSKGSEAFKLNISRVASPPSRIKLNTYLPRHADDFFSSHPSPLITSAASA